MSKEGYQLFLNEKPCRCCGLEKSSGIDLQDQNNERATILLKDLSLLPKKVINLSSSDKLTKFICFDCEMTLHHFGEFCEMIKKVQKTLKSVLKASTVEHNQDKSNKKTDCHVSGLSSDGSPVVISVGADGNFKCEDCHSSLVLSQVITLHMLTHGLGTVLCSCNHCSHREDIGHFVNSNDEIKCPRCLFVSFQEKAAIQPTTKAPVSGEGHVCEVCNTRFKTKYRYNRHKLIHIGVKPFLCETCGMKFNQKTSLKLHVMKHAKLNPHSCQWCGQTFRFKVSLRSHILNIHGSNNLPETETKYECDQCRKQFATLYKLRRHYRLHTGDRPYSCPVCSKRFSQTGNFKNHLKKHKSNNFSTFSTDLLENDQILDTILDSCPQDKEWEQQEQQNYNIVNPENIEKHDDIFSDFNPQDVLFDNTPIMPSTTNSPIILPTFSSLQGGPSDINL